MQKKSTSSKALTVKNFRKEIKKLLEPHKDKIQEASNNFKQMYLEYQRSHPQKKSVYYQTPIARQQQRTPSYLSQLSCPQEPIERLNKDAIIRKPHAAYDLNQWQFSEANKFKDKESMQKYYEELFQKKKVARISNKSYDFKTDEKEMLIRIFEEIKGDDDCITYENVVAFFQQCNLFYLCYNIRPQSLLHLLKESSHHYSDRLSRTEFLNIFFLDRPNFMRFDDYEQNYVAKRCILSQESWKDLKNIFSTLDTFGNETISIGPFIYKIKNNYGNRALINQPAIEYPEIKRTISIKKIIFNIEHRCPTKTKMQWRDIQNIFRNYHYQSSPTIDLIYKRMIQKGKISKFTNYFMLDATIIQEIKNIYYRCPKYCEYFVKTQFIIRELLESAVIKQNLREATVRIIENGTSTHYVKLQDQIRNVPNEAENYIDLDQLLEFFSIRGPINTGPDTIYSLNTEESSDEETTLKRHQLNKAKSLEKIKNIKKKTWREYKPVRHLTVCQQFQLSQNKGQSTMARKTRITRTQKEAEAENQLKKKFKANPIPVQLNSERYKDYIKKMEEERQLKREQFQKRQQKENKIYQYLKTNTLLFDKKQVPKFQEQKQNVSFTPKSIPWFVSQVYMLDKINEKKQLRKRTFHAESKARMLKDWKSLPNMVHQQHILSEGMISGIDSGEITENARQSKVKEVPNFPLLQRQFAESLEKKKLQWKATVPIQFNFSSHRHKIWKSEENQRNPLERVKSQKIMKKSRAGQHKASIQACIAKQKINIPSTIKHQQMVMFTRSKLNQQFEQKQRKLNEQRGRGDKQRNFARFMRNKLKQTLRKSHSLHTLTQYKIVKHKHDWKQLQKQNQQDLCRMYSNVMNRPFLFQSVSSCAGKKTKEQSKHWAKLGKKNRMGQKQLNQKAAKHIHQSPLKAFEVQNNEQQSKKQQSPEHIEPYQEEQSAPYLNQSF